VNRTAEIVPRLSEDTDFEAPLGSKLEEIEPLVVWRLGGIEAFDVARIDVHRVDCGLAIIEPECCVIARWRLVRRPCRVVIGFQRAVWAFVITCDEPPNTGCLGWLVEVERLDELIALVLTHDRRERPPDIVPFGVVWLVIEVGFDGLTQLVVFGPRRDGFVRTGRATSYDDRWCRGRRQSSMNGSKNFGICSRICCSFLSLYWL